MSKARKLPSGKWNAQRMINGKRYSFTADTKKEAERLAALATDVKSSSKVTLKDAITRYIESKDNVLSPSTVRGYYAVRDNFLDESIAEENIDDITGEKLQRAINICAANHSAKSCANLKGLLTATMKMFRPSFTCRLQLPQKDKLEIPIPTDDQMREILVATENTALNLPVRMSAFGSLRISEISGLCPDCVYDDHIVIKRAMVRAADSTWVLKDNPKSYAGNRDVYLPSDIMKEINGLAKYCRPGDTIFSTPASIQNRWSRMLKQEGLPQFRFHSLRHYYATYCLGMGINEKIVQKNGGWSDLTTLKQRYQHTIAEKEIEARKMIENQFKALSK